MIVMHGGNHRVLDSNGNVNTSDSFIGNINPFRYKGYYYDKESNMYYCNSRYYVPERCRWLNADNINCLNHQDINGLNLFAYCNNNPVMYSDERGNMPVWAKCLLIGVMAIGAIALTVASCGMAAAGAGALATMGAYSLGIGGVAATLSTVASVGVYVATAASIAGVTAFAGAEIQQCITGSNYMSWLGSSYDTVKGVSYGVPFILAGLTSFAPVQSSTSETGTYIIKRGNNVVYVGKGSVSRMYTSMRNHLGTSYLYYPCSSEEMAFANEAYFMQHYGGAQSMGGCLENKINSPGLAKLFEWF